MFIKLFIKFKLLDSILILFIEKVKEVIGYVRKYKKGNSKSHKEDD